VPQILKQCTAHKRRLTTNVSETQLDICTEENVITENRQKANWACVMTAAKYIHNSCIHVTSSQQPDIFIPGDLDFLTRAGWSQCQGVVEKTNFTMCYCRPTYYILYIVMCNINLTTFDKGGVNTAWLGAGRGLLPLMGWLDKTLLHSGLWRSKIMNISHVKLTDVM